MAFRLAHSPKLGPKRIAERNSLGKRDKRFLEEDALVIRGKTTDAKRGERRCRPFLANEAAISLRSMFDSLLMHRWCSWADPVAWVAFSHTLTNLEYDHY